MQPGYLPFVALVILLTGCAKKNEPVMAHGKPAAYWLELLNAPDPKARKKAALALGHVGKADPAAIPALIGAVKDRDAQVRNEAVLALLNIGPGAKEAIPVLTEAQSDTEFTIRAHATKALERIQSGK